MKDLTGQRFGMLTAIRATEKRNRSSVVWECICDCGNTTLVDNRALSAGNATSCGCLREKQKQEKLASRVEALTGQRFGRLTLLTPAENQGGSTMLWLCRCDCGNTTTARLNALKRGAKQSCGCLQKTMCGQLAADGRPSLVGERFGRLTVLRQTEERINGNIAWECQCDCGETTLATRPQLKRGSKRSCGCLWKELSENRKRNRSKITPGQRFGRLVTLEISETRVAGAIAWVCQCDCGNRVLAAECRLRGGQKKSCGCLRKGAIFLPTEGLMEEVKSGTDGKA